MNPSAAAFDPENGSQLINSISDPAFEARFGRRDSTPHETERGDGDDDTGLCQKQKGGRMNIANSRSYPDATRLAELVQKIRVLKLDLSRIIEHSRDSQVGSRLIMASGLLDGALEELSKAASEQSD